MKEKYIAAVSLGVLAAYLPRITGNLFLNTVLVGCIAAFTTGHDRLRAYVFASVLIALTIGASFAIAFIVFHPDSEAAFIGMFVLLFLIGVVLSFYDFLVGMVLRGVWERRTSLMSRP